MYNGREIDTIDVVNGVVDKCDVTGLLPKRVYLELA